MTPLVPESRQPWALPLTSSGTLGTLLPTSEHSLLEVMCAHRAGQGSGENRDSPNKLPDDGCQPVTEPASSCGGRNSGPRSHLPVNTLLDTTKGTLQP